MTFINLPVAVTVALLALFVGIAAVGAIPAVQYRTSTRRVMNCDKFAKKIDECDIGSYHILLVLQVAPYAVVAGTLLFFIPCYMICKYVFNCCGGRRQSNNFCHPDKRSATVYSFMDLIRPRVLALLAAIVCLAAAVVGCFSASIIQGCMTDVQSRVSGALKSVEGIEHSHMKAMDVMLYDNKTDSVSSFSLLRLDTSAVVLPDLSRKRVEAVEGIYKRTVLSILDLGEKMLPLMVPLFLVPTFVTLVGLMVALCSCRRYISMFLFVCISVCGVGVWFSAGTVAAFGFFVTDGCFEVEELTEGRLNILHVLSECENINFTMPAPVIESLFGAQASKTCNALRPYCYKVKDDPITNAGRGSVLACPQDMLCDDVRDIDMSVWAASAFATAPEIVNNGSALGEAKRKGYTCFSSGSGEKCDLRRCATECRADASQRVSEVGRAAKAALIDVAAVAQARALHETEGSKLGNCEAVLETLANAMLSPCRTAKKTLVHSRGMPWPSWFGVYYSHVFLRHRSETFYPLEKGTHGSE